jgi:hypothetical protein
VPGKKNFVLKKDFFFICRLRMRCILLVALLACANAIPTLHFPGDEASGAVNSMEDNLHSEFLSFKAKVSIFVLHRLIHFFKTFLTTVPAVTLVFDRHLFYTQSKIRFWRNPLLDMVWDLAIPRPCRREAGES